MAHFLRNSFTGPVDVNNLGKWLSANVPQWIRIVERRRYIDASKTVGPLSTTGGANRRWITGTAQIFDTNLQFTGTSVQEVTAAPTGNFLVFAWMTSTPNPATRGQVTPTYFTSMISAHSLAILDRAYDDGRIIITNSTGRAQWLVGVNTAAMTLLGPSTQKVASMYMNFYLDQAGVVGVGAMLDSLKLPPAVPSVATRGRIQTISLFFRNYTP